MAPPLKKFYFCQSKDPDGIAVDNLVLNTETLNLGRIIFYPSYGVLLTSVPQNKAIAHHVLTGYNIVLYFAGNLATGNRLAFTPRTVEDLRIELAQMGAFFRWLKIDPKPKAYRKSETALNP